MKKITFPSFFLFLAMIQNAQVLQVKVNWGEKYSVRDFGKYINQKPIGHTDNYIFIRHKYQ